MNCADFHERLQRRLDDRVRPETDRDLVRHTQQCEDCRGQLEIWRRVASLMPSDSSHVGPCAPSGTRAKRRLGWVVTGLAASIVLCFAAIRERGSAPASQSRLQASIEAPDRPGSPTIGVSRSLADAADPIGWWEEVQGRDWVSRTMPTVRSMQEGVAPLGRTLMRAVTILTIGGRDQAS